MNDFKYNSGVGLPGLLGVAFVVLKLSGHISWSWWFVTLPFWGIGAFILSLYLIGVLYRLIKKCMKY